MLCFPSELRAPRSENLSRTYRYLHSHSLKILSQFSTRLFRPKKVENRSSHVLILHRTIGSCLYLDTLLGPANQVDVFFTHATCGSGPVLRAEYDAKGGGAARGKCLEIGSGCRGFFLAPVMESCW
jgi:hypothetical protein